MGHRAREPREILELVAKDPLKRLQGVDVPEEGDVNDRKNYLSTSSTISLYQIKEEYRRIIFNFDMFLIPA